MATFSKAHTALDNVLRFIDVILAVSCTKTNMHALVDARGSELGNYIKSPKRIVSVVPSQTELLFSFGLHDEVIGITKFCVHPQQWFRTKTRIGGTKTLDLAKIKNLQPHVILANKEENVKEQIEELAKHFPVWVTDVNNLGEALETIETVGLLTGKEEGALELNVEIKTAFRSLKQNDISTKLRVCYLIWNEPYMTVGGDTFINDMITQAGFVNCFQHKKRYPIITTEDIAAADCDAIMLSTEPFPFVQKHVAQLQQHFPLCKIALVNGELFSWYGSRLRHAPAYFKTLQLQLV